MKWLKFITEILIWKCLDYFANHWYWHLLGWRDPTTQFLFCDKYFHEVNLLFRWSYMKLTSFHIYFNNITRLPAKFSIQVYDYFLVFCFIYQRTYRYHVYRQPHKKTKKPPLQFNYTWERKKFSPLRWKGLQESFSWIEALFFSRYKNKHLRRDKLNNTKYAVLPVPS